MGIFAHEGSNCIRVNVENCVLRQVFISTLFTGTSITRVMVHCEIQRPHKKQAGQKP